MAFSILGCDQKESKPKSVDKPLAVVRSELEDPNGNFVLWVGNQSFAITPVDIRVTLDGVPVLHKYFAVGNQHNWEKYTFRLKPGQHTLKATTKKGSSTISRQFDVQGKHWAVLDYWFYPNSHFSPTPRQFMFQIKGKPIGFR